MSSLPEAKPFPPPGSFRPWTQALLTVLVAAAAVYLISNHWLHVLDALPYLGVMLVMSTCMFGHGGHGGHGSSHQGHGGQEVRGGAARLELGEGAGHVH